MNATFRVLDGAYAGASYTPTGAAFVAGRHHDAELRFDPERDLSVSARHARFERRAGCWYVQDLASRNGTFVNGQVISGEVALHDGDRVRFGVDGPEVQVSAAASTSGTVTLRIRTAVRQERRRAAILAAAVLAVVLLAAAVLATANLRSRSSWYEERGRLEQRIDSLIAEGRQIETSLQTQVAGLHAALQNSERRLQRLRSELDAPVGAGGDADELRRDLLATTAALRRQQLAASLDFATIQRRTRAAVAMVWIEYTDGERMTGTAFAVRPDGTLLTNRHLVSGARNDRRPRRIAVRFADSDQTFPARLAAVSAEWDLAVLKLTNVLGSVPFVASLNTRADTIAPGSPLALIGFPLGGEPERDPALSTRIARPVVSAALVLRSTPAALEVEGFGADGASGSPMLDSNGEVIAVLFGGRTENGVQVLLGVPAHAAGELLNTVR